MNQITTRYITEGDACYEQYVISDPAAKTELVITPERVWKPRPCAVHGM